MTRTDLTELAHLADLDRFLQWDLITVTPFGSPAVAPVGARLLVEKAEVWTSTTAGYGAKLRNIRLHPRVALLRAGPGARPVLLRGEASLVSGDGTANLRRLFELMGGAGTPRAFFGKTATSPLWRALYREYWRRILIRVRITEVCQPGAGGWQTKRVQSWRPLGPEPDRGRQRAGRPKPSRPVRDDTDLRGREMLSDQVPALLAVVEERMQAPLAFPVAARPSPGGSLQVHHAPGLPLGRSRRASLAVRLVDDSFEVARMVGWIGTLEKGRGWRDFHPRSDYGFAKPPGIVPDIAAAVAAAMMNLRADGAALVSPPRLALAADPGPATGAVRLQLGEPAWLNLERLFLSCAAAAPWHATMASLAADPGTRAEQAYLARRAELERDWAHALLVRGRRHLEPVALSRAALLALPRSADPRAESQRQERIRERWRAELGGLLPDPLWRGLLPARAGAGPAGGVISRRSSATAAALTLAGSMAAACDRLLQPRGT